MLNNFVGSIDWPSAIVLIALACSAAFTLNALILRKWHYQKLANDLELAKVRGQLEHERYLAQYENDRAYKMKQLEQNLITSHKVDESQRYERG